MISRAMGLLAFGYDLFVSKIYPFHVPSAEENAKADAQRQAAASLLKRNSNNSDVHNHVQAFGTSYAVVVYHPKDHNGQSPYGEIVAYRVKISSASMFAAFTKDLGLNQEEAESLARGSMALAYVKGLNGVYFYPWTGLAGEFLPEDAVPMMHARDSGVFKRGSGDFDYEQFKKVVQFSVRDYDGKRVISLDSIRRQLDKLAKTDTRWEDAGYIDQQLGALGNDGEFKTLLKIMATRWIEVEPGKFIPHAKLTDLKRWWLDTYGVMQDKRAGRLALPSVPSSTASINSDLYVATASTKTEPKTEAPTMPVKPKDWFDKVLGAACQFAYDLDLPKGYGLQKAPTFFNDLNGQVCVFNGTHAVAAINPPATPAFLGQ